MHSNGRGRSRLRIPISTRMRKKVCCDDETGEILDYGVNDETGERSMRTEPTAAATTGKWTKTSIKFPRGSMAKTKKFQTLKANIIAGSNTTSHRLFLLVPTLMFFPSLICVMLIILELYLHIRCHKKNKKLDDPNLYYRSPFHIVTRTFCGACRESDLASKVGQLQDKRRHHYDYFRRIAI